LRIEVAANLPERVADRFRRHTPGRADLGINARGIEPGQRRAETRIKRQPQRLARVEPERAAPALGLGVDPRHCRVSPYR
jgi:hypothetical protein